MKPPSLEASAAPEPAEPPEPASSSHVVGPKVHQTPFQLLEGLLPSPDFSILLDENAWRFKVECKVKGQVFEALYQTFNGSTVTWQESLTECHKYTWNKWAMIKKNFQCFQMRRKSLAISKRKHLMA